MAFFSFSLSLFKTKTFLSVIFYLLLRFLKHVAWDTFLRHFGPHSGPHFGPHSGPHFGPHFEPHLGPHLGPHFFRLYFFVRRSFSMPFLL